MLLAAKNVAPDDVPTSLDELSLRLSMARGIDEVMAVVRRGARALVHADGVSFVLRDNGMCYYADEDAISPLWKGQRFPIEKCISGWAMLHREPVVIENVYADERIPHAAYRTTFVRSLIMVPVRREDPVAAIGAYWARQRRPTDDEVLMVQSVANSAAVAMTNIALASLLDATKNEMLQAKQALFLAMSSLAETRDNETGNHLRRTQLYVRKLAESAARNSAFRQELDHTKIDLIFKSAPLHDIGKVGIPDHILLKHGKLTADEFAIMKTHVELGHAVILEAEQCLVTSNSFLSVAREIVYTHHEKWDGTGYPNGLKGKEIPLAGRLMAIADVYDALTSHRIYKPAMPHHEAVRIIAGERGKHFDPLLVDTFLEIEDRFATISRQFSDAGE